MVFASILDPILGPLLNLPPILSIFIISLTVTLLITLVYKYTTDQKKMKTLKEKQKEYQKKLRAVSKESPEKAMKMQKEAMETSMEYMRHSFKSTLYTLIPVIIIFSWLSTSLAYYPIAPGQEFSVTAEFAEGHASQATLSSIPDLYFLVNQTQPINNGTATWRLSGGEGEYKLTLEYNSESYDINTLITSSRKYLNPEKTFTKSKLEKIIVGNEKVYAFQIGSVKFTWFWTYVLFSILLSILIRKLMKVY